MNFRLPVPALLRIWCVPGLMLLLGNPMAVAAEPVLPGPVDRVEANSNGIVIPVPAGGDFQAALAQAEPGNIIELAAGAVFEGPFVLPAKAGADWITIRSAQFAVLPPTGVRIRPADAGAMPTLTSARGAVLTTAPGAHHYRFIGVAFSPTARRATGFGQPAGNAGVFLDALVQLGEVPSLLAEVPHHFSFEHCLLQADTIVGGRRGIVLNAAHTTVRDSHLAGFRMVGEDSQALVGWAGPGPFSIVNNYLEAAGENLMFGGGDPGIAGLVPADIEIRGNHFAKQTAWKEGEAGFAATRWSVKNLLELKNARRVLITGNLFEYNWEAAQNGYAILFTVRNQDGTAPWSVVEDVSFTNNIVRHVGSGINVLGFDDNATSAQTRRIAISNNLFTDLGGNWGEGTLLQMLDGTADVSLEHNTVLNDGRILWSGGRNHSGFVFSRNIVRHNEYGMIGDNAGIGNGTLQLYFSDAEIADNLLVGAAAANYPRANAFPRNLREVGFMDAANADYRLQADSRWRKNAAADPGVDFTVLCAALSATELEAWCAPPNAPRRQIRFLNQLQD